MELRKRAALDSDLRRPLARGNSEKEVEDDEVEVDVREAAEDADASCECLEDDISDAELTVVVVSAAVVVVVFCSSSETLAKYESDSFDADGLWGKGE